MVQLKQKHRVISFSQEPRLKPYIDLNRNNRKDAKHDFEKAFFKLMNNSVFGKRMENVKIKWKWKLSTKENLEIENLSKNTFKSARYIDGLYVVEFYEKEIVYNKPVYVGASILDLSKLTMMKFHWDVIHKTSKVGIIWYIA